jgi:serine/threonine protein kinase
MREEPPQELVQLLEPLNLATPAQVRGVARLVRRLAEGLPLFESVWVDALAQVRLLTPFQATEINAGRGPLLKVGPFVLTHRLPSLGYADVYRAREIASGKSVRLTVALAEGSRLGQRAKQLEMLASNAAALSSPCLAPVTSAGVDGNRLWAAGPDVEGRTADQWMVHNGRFPSEAVLEIARQMLPGLVLLEKAGIAHGDLSAASVLLTDDGQVVLCQPGIRGILRPEEGHASADLLPQYFDGLAPERVAQGTPPSIAGDLYACGYVWWHLLTGRTPVPGGDSLAKLRAIETARIIDVRRLAPDAPSSLSAAVMACLRREPSLRPESMVRLAATLGTSTHSGRHLLAECLHHPSRRLSRWAASIPSLRDSGHAPLWLAAVAGCLVAAITFTWSLRPASPTIPPAAISAPPAAISSPPLPPGDGKGEGIDHGRTILAATQPAWPPGLTADPPATRHDTLAADPPASRHDADAADLILPGGQPLRLASLTLRAGQCVRGEGRQRPLLLVPAGGLLVQSEKIRFQNVDFLWSGQEQFRKADFSPPRQTGRTEVYPTEGRSSSAQPAIVRIEAARAEFQGCSFQASRSVVVKPAALQWAQPGDNGSLDLALPTSQIRLKDCVFRQVAAAVDTQRAGAVGLDLANVLYLGEGPLVHLRHCPRFDEPLILNLTNVTLRGCGPLLECAYDKVEDQPGKIAVQAESCAFVPAPCVPLILLSGEGSPQQILSALDWTGQGSLVSPEAVIAQWKRPAGQPRTLDEGSVSMAGMVRSAVTFAGDRDLSPAANRINRWQVPLRSASPPGIDPRPLLWADR